MDSVGMRLKKIRLEKGLTLEEVHKKTRIHLNILNAIEEDSLINVSPIYMKGFLKIYCKFLGVDPRAYISNYKEVKMHVSLKKPELKSSFIKSTSLRLRSWRPSKKIKKILILGLTALIAIIILFNLAKAISTKIRQFSVKKKAAVLLQQKGVKKTQKLSRPKAEAKALSKEAEVVPAKELKPASSGIRLGILAHENCWVSLRIDGKLVLQRVLEKGRLESWQAKEKIELSVGNAGAVELDVDGRHFTNLGRKGQPRKNIIITKDGLR
jgi:cytoskeletal protein RodZ